MNLVEKSYQIRQDVLDLVYNGKAGHIGGDYSVCDILVTLYYHVMNMSPEKVNDPNRDRFILSKGHSVESLYCILADQGYFPKEDLETYSQFGSKYIGHPNNKINRNRLQISGSTEVVMHHEDLGKRFESFGWHVIHAPGNDISALIEAFEEAKATKGMPTMIIADTVKGCGVSFMENQAVWHHKVPTEAEYIQAKEELKAKEAQARE